jgi:calretinin
VNHSTFIRQKKRKEKMSKEVNFLRKYRDASSKEFIKLTASQFMEIWNHYDSDHNGWIEGKELDTFLRELCSSVSSIDSNEVF